MNSCGSCFLYGFTGFGKTTAKEVEEHDIILLANHFFVPGTDTGDPDDGQTPDRRITALRARQRSFGRAQ